MDLDFFNLVKGLRINDQGGLVFQNTPPNDAVADELLSGSLWGDNSTAPAKIWYKHTVGSGVDKWAVLGDVTTILAELGYIRTFIGKDAAGVETPNYPSNNVVTDGLSLETAIGQLDAKIGIQDANNDITNPANTLADNIDNLSAFVFKNGVTKTTTGVVSTPTNVDSAIAQSTLWIVKIFEEATPTNIRYYLVFASHDGTTPKFVPFAILQHGNILFVPTLSTTLTSGNTINLRVNNPTAVTVKTKRVGIIDF